MCALLLFLHTVGTIEITKFMAELEKMMPTALVEKFRDTPIKVLHEEKDSINWRQFSFEELTYLVLRIYQEKENKESLGLLDHVDFIRLFKYHPLSVKYIELEEDCYYNFFYRIHSFLLNIVAYDIRQELYDNVARNFSNLIPIADHDLTCLQKRMEKFQNGQLTTSSEYNHLRHFIEVQLEARKILQKRKEKQMLFKQKVKFPLSLPTTRSKSTLMIEISNFKSKSALTL